MNTVSSSAAAQAHPPPPTEGADFGVRAAARIIDTVVLIGLGLVGGVFAAIALLLAQLVGLTDDAWLTRIDNGPLSFLFSIAATTTFFTVSEAWCGASIGKLLLGLRVIDLSGARPSIVAGLKRSVATFFDFFFFGAVAWSAMQTSPARQRYGDRWARTMVVSKSDPGVYPASGSRLALGVLAGSVAAAAVHALGVVWSAL